MNDSDDQIASSKRKIEAILASKKYTSSVRNVPTKARKEKITIRVRLIKMDKRLTELEIEVNRLRGIIHDLTTQ